jgi:hypothetical protein
MKSDEKRIERNKKQREVYQMKKDESQSKAVPAVLIGGSDIL